MKNFKRIAAAGLIGAMVFSASGCGLIQKTPEAIAKTVVAKVNDETITKGEFDKRMQIVTTNINKQYGANYSKSDEGKKFIESEKKQLLDEMVNEMLSVQEAKKLKVMPTTSDINTNVDKSYKDALSQYSNDEAKFKASLKQYGFDEPSYKEYLKTQYIVSKVEDYVNKDTKISDDTVKQYYDSNKNKFTTDDSTIHVEHILVKTEDEAKKVKTRLDAGEDFAKVAKEVSIEPAAKTSGGDLGEIKYNDSNYDATFMQAAEALDKGKTSDPVHTSYGYHIIRCIDKKVSYKTFDSVKDSLKEELLETQKQNTYAAKLKAWKKTAKVTENTNEL